jgi:predicted nucleic acid-binding protein
MALSGTMIICAARRSGGSDSGVRGYILLDRACEPTDQWHEAAEQAKQSLHGRPIITTEEVLSEFLTFFSQFGSDFRATAARLVRGVMSNADVTLLPQSHGSFVAGLHLYESRLDKDYSFTDCVSMTVMRELKIHDVLSHDRHFAQEGFKLLLV